MFQQSSYNPIYLNWIFIGKFLLIFWICLFSTINPIQTASFYGQSYIKIPFREFSNKTSVELRFKTHQTNAFIFLAAGSSDYFLIYLEYGQLAVRINFGSGETYFTSGDDNGPPLNDLNWHHLKLETIEKNYLLIKIDNDKRIFTKKINSIEKNPELKILYGIYLGSQNNFKTLYLGDLKPLRGCLDDVYFNNRNILDLAKIQQQAIIIHEVSIDEKCDEEFNTIHHNNNNRNDNTTSISFVHHDSFVLLPGLQHYSLSKNMSSLTVQFDLKTISNNALLLFSPGKNPYKKEYFVVEIIRKRLKATINDGINENHVFSSIPLNDNHWHRVEIIFESTRSQLEISVDGKRDMTSSLSSPSSTIQLPLEKLSNELFVGGVSSERQSLAVNYGIESSLIEPNISLKGCLKNIKINFELTSLLDAIATKKIMIGKCKWQLLCFDQDKSPCIPKSECVQNEINRIKCFCPKLDCVKKNFKHKTIAVESELLASMPGSHDDDDSMVRSDSSDSSIQSMNDAPERQTVHFKILANSKFTLSSNFFKHDPHHHHQKDSKSLHKTTAKNKKVDELKFKVIRINNNGNDNGESFLAKINEPNVKLESFSENDVKNGWIQFVHHDNGTSSILEPIEVVLHAYHEESFKTNSNNEKEIHLIFKPYRIDTDKLINTGLLMAYKTSMLITSTNLSLLMMMDNSNNNENYEQQNDERDKAQLIRFELINEPQYGILQKLRMMPNNWVNISQFTQRQIDRAKIRYQHINGFPDRDVLQLRILFNKQLINTIKFSISFVKHLKINSFGTNVYNFSRNEKEFLLTTTEMSFQTEPVLSDSQTIFITLESVPSYGTLYLLAKNTLQKKLQLSSQFTQRDIEEKRILYVRNNSFINIDSIRDLVDSFSFNVNMNSSDVSRTSTFYIYLDNSMENYVLINRKLTVLEGDKSLIDENHLFLRSVDITKSEDVVFEIIKSTKFGSIEILYDDHLETCPNQIPQKKIQQKKVFYIHDDSENNIDFFDFSIRNFSDNGIISGKFSIEIIMKNDNPPMRKVNNRLNVIKNSEKILSNSDISYMDQDLNTFPSNIIYEKIYSPIGLFQFLNGSIVQTFTQQHIDDGMIKFHHNGSDEGKAVFSITDGHFVLSESLEIKASEPYISVNKNTGIIVRYGETNVISSKNLSIETNLPDKKEIFIKLLTEPRLGQILINEKSTNHFTLKELEEDLVEYESTIFEDESPYSKNDSIEFRVYSNDKNHPGLVSKSHEFLIRIFPLTYFNLNIVNMKNLSLFEESQALIDSKTLMVTHSEMKPYEITYRITKNPGLGVIKNLKNLEDHQSQSPLPVSVAIDQSKTKTTFTQQDINNGLILYQNSKSEFYENDYITERYDLFEFEVGNDVYKVTDLTFFIELIPKYIILATENLTVNEGNTAILTRKHIHLTHPYYRKYVDEFIVVEEPKYGTVSLIGRDNIKLSAKSFTGLQLDQGKICYQHDSSEYEKDWFTIVARANSIEKESLPATIHITVTSINDEAPVIVNLTEVDVWQNQKVQINNASLAAIDKDSKPNEILFLISMPFNGYLVNLETNNTVDKFTQADIDSGRIYFVHVGSGNGSFRFHVTDGKNYGTSNIFKIKVRHKKINIDINQKLLVTPGTQQSITNRHLQVSSSEPDESREFIYRIVKTPSYGRIILEGFKHAEEINSFTQQQLNENLVLYDQNVPTKDPIVLDRIIFNIESSDMPPIKSVHFIIEIAVENMKDLVKNTEIDSLIPIEPLIVYEGKFNTISLKERDLKEFLSKLKYKEEEKIFLKIIRQPIHGIILKNGLILDNLAIFPITTLRNQSIVYMHDDTNTLTDSVVFSLFTKENFLISIMNLTWPIRIIPVNDEFPVVVNRNPRLKANFGSKTLISKEILNTRDNDGNDTKIIYLLRKENITKEGFISKLGSHMPIYHFTQQDINDKKIYFIHHGPRTRFLFWFRVKDDDSVLCSEVDVPKEINYEQLLSSTIVESHCTAYFPFSITVTRFSVQLINQTTIQLNQGSRRTAITNSNLAVKLDTSENAINVQYSIKRGPYNGHILVENRRSLEFNQKQVNEHRVFYVQDNMFREDSFIVDIFQAENEKILKNVNVKIIVVPLVKAKKPFLTAYPGQKSLLTIEHIDASELFMKTDSNPRFRIIKNPNHGKLNILHYGKDTDEDSTESISEFTQEDLIQNRIVYVANSDNEQIYSNEILTDIVEYELSALNVQNAHGVLVINIFHNQTEDFNDVFIKNNYFSYFGMSLVKEQFFLFLIVVLLLILLIPSLIIIFRMCLFSWPKSNNKCHKDYVAQNLAPCHHPDHSSICSRPNDSSSHYSSSTTFDQTVVHPDMKPTLSYQKPENINLKLIKEHPKKSYTREEMSPLPPPSLYFINDQSFDNQWDKIDTPNLEMEQSMMTDRNRQLLLEGILSDKIPAIEDELNDLINFKRNKRSRSRNRSPSIENGRTSRNSNKQGQLQQSYGTLENKNVDDNEIPDLYHHQQQFKNPYWI